MRSVRSSAAKDAKGKNNNNEVAKEECELTVIVSLFLYFVVIHFIEKWIFVTEDLTDRCQGAVENSSGDLQACVWMH